MRLSIECISNLIISHLHKFIAFEIVSKTIVMALPIWGCSFETTANLSGMHIFMQILAEEFVIKKEKNTCKRKEIVLFSPKYDCFGWDLKDGAAWIGKPTLLVGEVDIS